MKFYIEVLKEEIKSENFKLFLKIMQLYLGLFIIFFGGIIVEKLIKYLINITK